MPWWSNAVVYQVFMRSFADGNGDGLGDIAGLRSRLPYLAELGVDGLWINPWYPSPMRDAGYDVVDHRDVDPRFGTLAEAEAMMGEAHELGLRVLLDLVPNHTSDQHPWFREAVAAAPGSAARERFIFRDGRGAGEKPPNDWQSWFGGPAWTRVAEPDGRPGQWYLHLFAAEQPDLNWASREVRAEFEETMRFWFDLGADGFRVDVAHGLVKAEGLPDLGSIVWPPPSPEPVDHPFWDREEVHEIYRRWRALGDSYDDPRVFVGEAWVYNPERLARYVRRDELQMAFNFELVLAPWKAHQLRGAIEAVNRAHEAVGAVPSWVLSNHDTVREVSRYARPAGTPGRETVDGLLGLPADFELGLRRARAAALLMLALPGNAYIYQGEELGLAEVEDLPPEARADPIWEQSGGTARGRDGSRVPLPWSGDEPPFGFSPGDAAAPPWLPQPKGWRALTVEAQTGDRSSTLELYRGALELRRTRLGDREHPFSWLEAPSGALAFARGESFVCVANVSANPFGGPEGASLLIASGPLTDEGRLPPDTAAWYRR